MTGSLMTRAAVGAGALRNQAHPPHAAAIDTTMATPNRKLTRIDYTWGKGEKPANYLSLRAKVNEKPEGCDELVD